MGNVARAGDLKAGVSVAAMERNFGALPSELNRDFLNQSILELKAALQRKYGDDLDKKIERLKELLAQFKAGTVAPECFVLENAYAVCIVLMELRTERLAKHVFAVKNPRTNCFVKATKTGASGQ
jgi:hypothetical protein